MDRVCCTKVLALIASNTEKSIFFPISNLNRVHIKMICVVARVCTAIMEDARTSAFGRGRN